jgi:hypothetical protein
VRAVAGGRRQWQEAGGRRQWQEAGGRRQEAVAGGRRQWQEGSVSITQNAASLQLVKKIVILSAMRSLRRMKTKNLLEPIVLLQGDPSASLALHSG